MTTPLRLVAPAALAAMALLSILGCQGKEDSPATPQEAAPPAQPAVASPAEGMMPLSLAKLILDTNAGTAELVPIADPRLGAAIGDAYALDASSFFREAPCTSCMRIVGFGRDEVTGGLSVDVRLAHPFPDDSTRKDLDAFDPRIVVISPEDPAYAPMTWGTPGADVTNDGIPEPLFGNTKLLLNPDGYTTHFDQRVEELLRIDYPGTLNPYKNYYTDIFPNDPDLFSRNPFHRFSQTAVPQTQSFVFAPSISGVLEVYILLEVAWGQASTKDTRLLPQYYLPWFNMKEAYRVDAADSTHSLTSILDSSTTVRVVIEDWQSPAEQNATYPNPARPDWIPLGGSTVTGVSIECPALSNVVFNGVQQGAGSGSPTLPFNFDVTLANNNAAPAGSYPALVVVTDTLNGITQSIVGISPSLGFTNDVRAYRMIDLVVQDPTTFLPVPGLQNINTGVARPVAPYANAGPGPGDIAVFNNGNTVNGVLLPTVNGDVFRYALDYSAGALYAPGRLPFDDYTTNPHPSPLTQMPIRHLEAADDGSIAMTFDDGNFTFDPNGLPGSTLNRALPMSDFVAFTDNDLGLLFPAPRFIGGCGEDCINPPTCDVSGLGEIILGIWNDAGGFGFDNPFGYMSGGLNTERCNTTLDYYVFGAPYQNGNHRQNSGNANLLYSGTYAASPFLTGFLAVYGGTERADGSQPVWVLTNDTLYEFDSREAFTSATRTSVPTTFTERVVLDPINDIGLEPVDISVLHFDPDTPRNHGGIGQTTDWLVLLLRDFSGTGKGVLRVFNTQPFSLLQEIDGRAAVGLMDQYVTAVDVDNARYELHVAMESVPGGGGIYFTSVFGLQP